MPEAHEKEMLVKLKDISLSADGVSILHDVSLTIPSDKITTLIGPNGAGKTTLLKIILGIVRPDSGSVWKKPGLKTGYVPQKTNIPKSIPLTVERFLQLDAPYTCDKIKQALEETGIESLLKRSVHPLSGGEMQRVMLARTLLKQPDLLVLDEPAQGLDPVGEERFYALLAELNRVRKCAIIMVSHDLHIVMARTHQVFCLNKHICCSGSPNEVVALPGYHHLFGKESELALYHHHHDHTHLPNGKIEHVD